MKTCAYCGIEKDESKFYLRGDSKKSNYTNKVSFCKECCTLKRKLQSRNNFKSRIVISRFIDKDLELRRTYGITLQDYNQMCKERENKCDICKEISEILCVDHCHNTDIIRGLLCKKCNTGLGSFKDNVENLQRAVEYLKKPRPKSSILQMLLQQI